jgi:hypothetical protein
MSSTEAPKINKMSRHMGEYREVLFKDIRNLGKFYAAQARQHLYKRELLDLKHLPELPDEIAEKIALLCWNPWLLCHWRPYQA